MPTPVTETSDPLAKFALSVADAVNTPPGTTAYTYEALTTPVSSDKIPEAALDAPGGSSIDTDCSGWVNYRLGRAGTRSRGVSRATRSALQQRIHGCIHPLTSVDARRRVH